MCPLRATLQVAPARRLKKWIQKHAITSFINSFIHSFIQSFIHSFINSSNHSFIQSFILHLAGTELHPAALGKSHEMCFHNLSSGLSTS